MVRRKTTCTYSAFRVRAYERTETGIIFHPSENGLNVCGNWIVRFFLGSLRQLTMTFILTRKNKTPFFFEFSKYTTIVFVFKFLLSYQSNASGSELSGKNTTRQNTTKFARNRRQKSFGKTMSRRTKSIRSIKLLYTYTDRIAAFQISLG